MRGSGHHVLCSRCSHQNDLYAFLPWCSITPVFSLNITSDLTASHDTEDMTNLPYNLYEDIMKLNMQVCVSLTVWPIQVAGSYCKCVFLIRHRLLVKQKKRKMTLGLTLVSCLRPRRQKHFLLTVCQRVPAAMVRYTACLEKWSENAWFSEASRSDTTCRAVVSKTIICLQEVCIAWLYLNPARGRKGQS